MKLALKRPRMERLFWLACGLLILGLRPTSPQVPSLPASLGHKKALLVGISHYPQIDGSSWSPLNAHRDVMELRDALGKHGFALADVHILEDSDATAEGIRAAFRRYLIEPAQRGDVLWFHFSGHGQQILDDNGDELDGLDESLVPVEATDQGAAAGAKVNLRDDELAVWLKTLTNKLRGPNGRMDGSVTVSLDSCASGTATRGRWPERGHGWERERDGSPPAWRAASDSYAPLTSLRESDGEYVLISAAQRNESAKERDGMGVFSRALVRALGRATKDTTYNDLLNDILYEVAASEIREQSPVLEGPADRLLFQGQVRASTPLLRALSVNGQTLTLPLTELHLATVGSVYALYQDGREQGAKNIKLAEAEVIHVGPLSSTLQLRPSIGSLPEVPTLTKEALLRATAVELRHNYLDRPLRVRLDRVSAKTRMEIQSLSVAVTASSKQTFYDVEVRESNGLQQLFRPESAVPFFQSAISEASYQTLEQVLKAEWRWRNLMSLQSTDSRTHVKLRIVPVDATIENNHLLAGPKPRRNLPQSEPLRLRVDDFFLMELQNPTNQPLYVTVLELGPDGRITLLFPKPGRHDDNYLASGKTFLLEDPSYLLKVSLPLGRSAFKVIATLTPLDLSLLSQQAYRSGQTSRATSQPAEVAPKSRPEMLDPLVRLLTESIRGERSRQVAIEVGVWGVTTTYLDQETGLP